MSQVAPVCCRGSVELRLSSAWFISASLRTRSLALRRGGSFSDALAICRSGTPIFGDVVLFQIIWFLCAVQGAPAHSARV
jgi:hypothetical protein